MPHRPKSRTRVVRVMIVHVKVLRQEVPVSHTEPDPHAVADDAHDGHDAHAVVTLGPIDWPAWAMAALGGALGLVVAAALMVAAAA